MINKQKNAITKTTEDKLSNKAIIQKKSSAKAKSFKITVIYFIVGCSWIFCSDKLTAFMVVDQANITTISIIKGLFYVLATSILIYSLFYPALKKAMNAQTMIQKVNIELEKSSELYKGLYQEFDKKQMLLKSLINSIPDLIFYKDIDCVYFGCNRAFGYFAGKPENEIMGRTDFELFDQEVAALFREADIEMMKDGEAKTIEEMVTYPDGNKVLLETLKTPYYDSEGNIIGLIGISRDISERKKKEEEIQYLNYHDVLTGVYNRAYFQEAQDRLDHEEQLPLSVIIGDVNGLKLINDALGHAEGDKLLIQIANIIKDCCRPDDIVARMGGDEFSVLLPKTDGETAWAIIEKINAVCAEYGDQEDKNIFHTNIALGYGTKTSMEESLDKITRSAEEFMYRRKLLEYKSLHSSILSSIKTTMFEKSNETEAHAERLAELSKKLGRVIGLSEEDMVKLELVSTLHDIGKISVDRNILTKTEKLTDQEWREIKKHPEVGFRIANASPELRHVSDYILSHHERWDGKGYPQGLSGEEIPLLSRIITIVDSYDAMTHDRSYRKAMPKKMAIAELLNHAGTQFDPQLVKQFVENVVS